MAGNGTQLWLEGTAMMVAKYTLMTISDMLNMVEIACMEILNVRSFINRIMRTPQRAGLQFIGEALIQSQWNFLSKWSEK